MNGFFLTKTPKSNKTKTKQTEGEMVWCFGSALSW